MDEASTVEHESLRAVADWLVARGYTFVTPTPETLRRNNARHGNEVARGLRDVFGFSRPFGEGVVPPAIVELLERAGAIEREGESMRATVRFSTLAGRLYLHSAYPTTAADSVFFGPDTYRFARFVGEMANLLPRDRGIRLVDIGCGSGAGGLHVAQLREREDDALVLADINPRALRHAAFNAALAEQAADCVESDVLNGLDGDFDYILANPPYMSDPLGRAYRDGGALHGGALSVRIAREAIARLAPGGVLALYTGAAVVDGVDMFREAVQGELMASNLHWAYEEIDPDVFGEELETAAYAGVERIAAVGLVVRRQG